MEKERLGLAEKITQKKRHSMEKVFGGGGGWQTVEGDDNYVFMNNVLMPPILEKVEWAGSLRYTAGLEWRI